MGDDTVNTFLWLYCSTSGVFDLGAQYNQISRAGFSTMSLVGGTSLDIMCFGYLMLNDGFKIPRLAIGSGSVNKDRDAEPVVRLALDHGVYHIDTAQYYRNEDSVGRTIRTSGVSREDIYLTTKHWDPNRSPVDTLRASLERLGTTYVNLYLIHSVSSIKSIPEAWKEMERAKSLGLARSIGVSNFGVPNLEEVLKVASIKPAVNQMRYHPYNSAEQASTLDFCHRHGILMEAYSSLVPLTSPIPDNPVNPVLSTIAGEREATIAQIIFLWVTSKGAVIVTTTSKEHRMKEYLKAGELKPLSQNQIERIDRACSFSRVSISDSKPAPK